MTDPRCPPEPAGAPETHTDGQPFEQDLDPPLYDPYVTTEPPPPPRISPLAVSSVVALIFGPVGAVLAIVFGHQARREIERSAGRRSGFALATVGMALGVLLTMGWGGALSYFALTYGTRVDPAGDEPGTPAPIAPAPTLRAPSPHPAPLQPEQFAPRHTRVKKEGSIVLVDVGTSSAVFAEELAKQRAEASRDGESLVIMTTAGSCDPCRGVDRSLADPLLQKALAGVRLLRVDVNVFHDDLAALQIPDQAIPGFFLPAPDLTPRDGVDGGEWDDDIPRNIAPVLGAFVRGKYTQRRRPWHPIPVSGVTL